MKAEKITSLDMLRFVWRERWNVMSFLRWAGSLEKRATAGRE
ncbi:MAG: hypothetical protein WAM66_11555 [Acidobacteriaceae bacterium]